MTCAHCKHSEGRGSTISSGTIIWCRLYRTIPTRVCADWCREPGVDDE